MTKPFAEVRALIADAKEQLMHFGEAMNALKKWEIAAELDQSTGLYSHMFRILDLDDMDLKIKARALVGVLRSSLDHLNAECARLAGATTTKGLHFPFGANEEDVKKSIGKKCKGVPQPVQDYFLSLAPYKGGDPYLYDLNRLRNQSEHVALMKFLPSVAAVQVISMSVEGSPFIIDVPDGVKEIELTKSPIPTGHYGVQILFGMPIEGAHQTSAFGFEPIIAHVERIVDHTEQIMIGLGLAAKCP